MRTLLNGDYVSTNSTNAHRKCSLATRSAKQMRMVRRGTGTPTTPVPCRHGRIAHRGVPLTHVHRSPFLPYVRSLHGRSVILRYASDSRGIVAVGSSRRLRPLGRRPGRALGWYWQWHVSQQGTEDEYVSRRVASFQRDGASPVERPQELVWLYGLMQSQQRCSVTA